MRKIYLLFILFSAFAINADAYHIAGGDLTTRWVSGNNFEIKLTLYRDCLNPSAAPYDNTIILAIYNKANDALLDTVTMDLNQNSIIPIELSGRGCSPPTTVCLESGYYLRTVTIPDNPAGYYIVWERCCRNNTIVNIVAPQAAGMAFYEEIPDPALHNSSPVFNSPPAPYTCKGQYFQFAFQATDNNGDSLVYELTDPLNGGHTSMSDPNPFSIGAGASGQTPLPAPYDPINWQLGFGLTNICGSALPLAINSSTGVVDGTPDGIGIYAMAVTVYEYRNGILLGIVRREIEFTSLPCDGNDPPDISPSIANKDYDIYVTDTLCFDVTATDANGDSIFLTHTGEVFENTPLTTITAPYAVSEDTTGHDSLRTSFCWIPSCDQSRDSAYLVTYQIKDNGCPLPLLVNGKFRIKVNKLQVIDKPNFLCLHFESDDIIKLIKVPDNTINARYFKGYTLYRSKNNSAFTALKHISDPFENIFYDSTATDNLHNIYCYYLTGTNNCNYESDNSDTLCSDNASNGNKNYIESVSVEAKNIISMKWEPFQDSYYAVYSIYRKKNSPEAAFEKVVELKNYADFEWKDFTVSTSENSYCYQMLNENVCGNISDISDDACSILLKGNADLFIDKLNWTSYINWRGNVGSYKTERNDENINIPYHDVNVIPFADTIAEDRDLPLDGGIFNYRIRAFEGSGGTGESLSNEIELIQAPALYLPTAFSPNADSKNDKWGFESVFVKSFNLILFNRWGQQIYHTDSPEDKWDGKYNGDEVPQGVYFFKLEFTGYNSKKVFEKSGSVTVIR